MNSKPSKLPEILEGYGYEKSSSGGDTLWRITGDISEQAVFAKIEILERKNTFHLSKCLIQIDSEKLSSRMRANLKKRLPRLIGWQCLYDADGKLRSLAEIGPSSDKSTTERITPTKKSPGTGTSIGWTTTITAAGGMISVQLTDAFFIGEPIESWWADISSAVSESISPLSAKSVSTRHMQELLIPVAALSPNLSTTKKRNLKLTANDLASIELPIVLKVSHNGPVTLIETSPSLSHTVSNTETPLEILEARETSAVWQPFDSKVIQRKNIKSLPSKDVTRRDILTRLAVAPSVPFETGNNPLETFIENYDRASLLTITGAIKVAEDQGRGRDKLNLLSNLFRRIGKTYGPIETLSPLIRISPEVLGDSWADVDPVMAYKAWEVALERSGFNPRLHRKISNLARQNGDLERELEALIALSAGERRKAELSVIAMRLLCLANENPELISERRTKILKTFEMLSGSLPENVQLILATAGQLRDAGQHRQALAMLDALISTYHANLRGIEISAVNAAIARIWRFDETNISLATSRYIQATSSPATPDDHILEEAEIFFAEQKIEAQLLRVLRLRSESLGSSSGTAALERSAKYAADAGKTAEALSDILSLIKRGRTQQWYLDIIESAQSIDGLDWETVANVMASADLKQLPRDSISPWKLMAARIAMKVPSLHDLAASCLSENTVIPYLSPEESQFVCTALNKEQSKNKLKDFISSRLSFCSSTEQEKLLKIAIAADLESSDGLFANSLAELFLATDDSTLSRLRAQRLIRSSLTQELWSLTKSHEALLAGRSTLTDFQDYVIQEICSYRNPDLISILDELLEARIGLASHDEIQASRLIKLVIRSGYPQIGSKFLVREIESGHVCIDDESMVTSILTSYPMALANWHYLSFKKATTSSLKLHHGEQTYSSILRTNERPSYLIEILSELTKSRRVSAEQLDLFEHISAREQRSAEFLSALSNYIEGTSRDSREPLIHWAIRIMTSQLNSYQKAAECYVDWMGKTVESKPEHLFTTGMLFFLAGLGQKSQNYLSRMLTNPETLQTPAELMVALSTLAKTDISPDNLATMTQTLISWSKALGADTLTAELIKKSVDWKVATLADLTNLFSQDFETETVDRLCAVALQILSMTDRSIGGVARVLNEWSEKNIIIQNRDKWQQLLSILAKKTNLIALKRQARCDVIYAYAKSLFDDDIQHLKSVGPFEALFKENPTDSRSWIPLYSLYEESGARQKLVSHLEKILPMVKRDSSALEKTPFNIESLKNSLRRAQGSSSKEQGGKNLEATGDLNQHDASDRLPSHLTSTNVELKPADSQTATNSPGEFGEALPSLPNVPTAPPASVASHSAFDGSSALKISPEVGAASVIIPETTQNLPAADADSGSHPAKNLSQSFTDTGANVQVDWRDMVTHGKVTPGLTEKVMKMAFASEVEKHVAVQCIALLSGETKSLDSWHWPVWRKPGTCDYSLIPAGRMPENETGSFYGSSLHKLLRMLGPVIIRHHRDKLTADGKLLKLGFSSGAPSVDVGLDHPAITRGMLRSFKSIVQQTRLRFRDTPRIGAHVFIDISTRSIHFDSKWQMNLPPTILTHRALELIVSFQRGQNALIDLDPLTDIIPVIDNVKEVLTSTGMNRLRIAFGMHHKEISDQLRAINRDQLVSLLSGTGSPSAKEISLLQKEMRLRSLRAILGSSLDVIGILEGLTGKDLCDEAVLPSGKITNLHPFAMEIIKFAAALAL